MEWHPDKHTGEEEKKVAEKKFHEIAEAYEILNDDGERVAHLATEPRGHTVMWQVEDHACGNTRTKDEQHGFVASALMPRRRCHTRRVHLKCLLCMHSRARRARAPPSRCHSYYF